MPSNSCLKCGYEEAVFKGVWKEKRRTRGDQALQKGEVVSIQIEFSAVLDTEGKFKKNED